MRGPPKVLVFPLPFLNKKIKKKGVPSKSHTHILDGHNPRRSTPFGTDASRFQYWDEPPIPRGAKVLSTHSEIFILVPKGR